MNETTKQILTNSEEIAVNQDSLGKQAVRIWKKGVLEIWAKPLSDKSWAVELLNRDDEKSREITLKFKSLNLEGRFIVRDLWQHRDLGEFENQFSVDVNSHEVVLVKIFKNQRQND